jgi:hypothetical protein
LEIELTGDLKSAICYNEHHGDVDCIIGDTIVNIKEIKC